LPDIRGKGFDSDGRRLAKRDAGRYAPPIEMSDPTDYVLRSERDELERLEHQSGMLEPATRLHLGMSGIGPGMRVLDLGTGIGDVAFLASAMVGPDGEVVGIDQAPQALAYAEQRRDAYGITNVRFAEGDVRTWRDAEPFDAVVGRLILFHMPRDAVAVVRHHADALRPGGVVLMMDFDVPAGRAEPDVPLVTETIARIMAAFRNGGADPVIGTRLHRILAEAGLQDVRSLGLQAYLEPHSPGLRTLAGVARTLLPVMERTGVATADEVGIDTLEDRLRGDVLAAGAVILPPTLVGAVGRTGS
jgi:SAM-dependent methyltransferase